jgi:hypothetical protein
MSRTPPTALRKLEVLKRYLAEFCRLLLLSINLVTMIRGRRLARTKFNCRTLTDVSSIVGAWLLQTKAQFLKRRKKM